jgi:4-hydroxybenzoyl-CoA thioesterase
MNNTDMPCQPAQQRPARFERCVRIRFSHCDPAGIVFYPQYFVLFNGLVEDWVTEELGIAYTDLLGPRRTGMPTVSMQIEFRAISKMGDDVTLGLVVEKLGARSLTVRLDCRAGDEERVRVRQVIVTTRLDTHRAIEIPLDLRAAIERFGVAPVRQPD